MRWLAITVMAGLLLVLWSYTPAIAQAQASLRILIVTTNETTVSNTQQRDIGTSIFQKFRFGCQPADLYLELTGESL